MSILFDFKKIELKVKRAAPGTKPPIGHNAPFCCHCTELSRNFFGKLALTRTPDPNRPTRRVPDSNRPTYGILSEGVFGQSPMYRAYTHILTESLWKGFDYAFSLQF